MKLFPRLGLSLIRVLARELTGIRQQLAIQTTLLSRLADHFAPIVEQHDQVTIQRETGVSYDDAADQFLLQEFAAKHYASTGHWPTDEECLDYLSDEKTKDLHQRLIDRDRVIEQRRREFGG